MSEPFMRDTFPEIWAEWAEANPIDMDVDEFLSLSEKAGLIECVPVDDDALGEAFAWERGIEPGGMMWQLTPAGTERYRKRFPQ